MKMISLISSSEFLDNDWNSILSMHEQDGNVSSRRHIWGSKIFKEQLLETFEFFFESIFFKSRTMPKNSKRGHSGSLNVFNISALAGILL